MNPQFDPSREWDSYINAQDDAAEAEMHFYDEYRDQITIIVGGMMANPNIGGKLDVAEIVTAAAKAMSIIVSRGKGPEGP